MVLESIVSNLLVGYLERYVQNFDPKSLNIGIWDGDVTLNNLLLKPDALDDISPLMPVVISFGVLEKLKITIPWTKMRSEPVVVEISNVLVVLKPKIVCSWNEKNERLKKHQLKLDALEKYESTKKNSNETTEETQSPRNDPTNPGFVAKLMEIIVNNLQIRLTNVHIRYEDTQFPQPRVLGATLESVIIESTDENYSPSFSKEIGEITYKLVQMNNFALYFNNKEDPKNIISKMNGKKASELVTILKDSIKVNQHKYVLDPMKASIHLQLQKIGLSTDFTKPQFEANFVFYNMKFHIDDVQYRDFLQIFSYFTNFPMLAPNRKFRPTVSPKKDPKGWWLYLLKAKGQEKKFPKFSWKAYLDRKNDQTNYIPLYKKYLQVPWEAPLTEKETDIFKSIELKRSLTDLLHFRKIANAEIQEEAKQHDAWKKVQIETQKKTSWFKFNFNVGLPTPGTIQLNKEQKQELIKFVGSYKEEEKELPTDYVKMKVHFHFVTGSLSLIDHVFKKPITTIAVADVMCDLQLLKGSFKCLASIGMFELHDRTNENTTFNKIISRRQTQGSSSSLMTLFMEKSPSGGKSDYYFGVNLDRVDIILNTKFIQKLIGFFNFDDINFKTLENLAKKHVKKVKQLAVDELRLALENKYAIDILLDIKAPNLIIPVDSEDKNSKFLFFDFGRFSLKSDIDTKRKERVKEEKSVKNSDYYDRFYFTMSDIQVMIPDKPADEFFSTYNSNPDRSIQILDKISFEIMIAKCIVPDQENLKRFLVAGKIPSVNMSLSPEKLETFLKLINLLIDLIINPTGDSNSDLKLYNKMKVSGPFTNIDNYPCTVQLKSTRKLFFIDSNSITKILAIIQLKDNINVIKSEENPLELELIVPSHDENYQFKLICENQKIRDTWVLTLRNMISTLDQNFSVHSFQNILLSDKEENFDLFKTKSKEQTILAFEFNLEKFTTVFQPRGNSNSAIAKLEFDKCSINMKHREYDTTLSLKVKSAIIEDLINSVDQEKTYVLLSDQRDKEDLVEITFKYSKVGSPIFEKDSITVLDFHFQSLQLFCQPNIVSELIELGFDIREFVDKVDTSERIYTPIAKVKLENLKFKSQIVDNRNFFKLSANSGEISLMLLNKLQKIVYLKMSGSSFKILVNKKQVEFTGTFGDVVGTDYSIKDNKHTEILGLNNKNGSIIEFSYIHERNSEKKLEYSKFFKARMNSVRYVHIQTFWKSLQDYLKGPLLEALKRETKRLDKIKIPNVKESKKVTLVYFDIEATNPTIIMPLNYKSGDYGLGDLGKISMKNEIKIFNNGKIVMENYNIKLNSMYISGVYNGNIYPAVNNSDVEFNIMRSVVNPNYDHPLFSMKVQVSEVNFTLSSLQYQMVFDIINGNIREGLDIKNDQKFYESILEEANKIRKNLEEKNKIDEKIEKNIDPSKALKVNVCVYVPKMTVKLLKGIGKDKEKDAIAQLIVNNLKWDNIYTVENTYKTEVTVEKIIGEDIRFQSNNAYPTIFDSMSNEKEDCLRFSFEQKPDFEKTLLLNLSSPKLMVIPEFILDFKDFFWNTYYLRRPILQEKNLTTEEIEEENAKKIDIQSLVNNEIFTDLKKQWSKKISFVGKFGRPTVVLPEDETILDTRHLTLELGTTVKLTRDVENGVENIIGDLSLKELKMFISSSDGENHGQPIVEPIILTANLYTEEEGKQSLKTLKFDIVEGGNFRISFKDIKFIYRIIKKFEKQTTNIIQPIIPLSNDVKEGIVDNSFLEAIESNIKIKVKLYLKCSKNLSVLIVDDIKDHDIPLFDIKFSDIFIEANLIQDKVLKIGAQLSFILSANYYNFSIAEWEPIIEKQDKLNHIKFVRKPEKKKMIVDGVKIKKEGDMSTSLTIQTSLLNFNMTSSMVNTVTRTSKLWIADLNQNTTTITTKFKMYAIKNECGSKIKFKISSNASDIEVDSGDEYRFENTVHPEEVRKNFYIYLNVHGFTHKILMNKIDKIFVPIEEKKSQDESNIDLMCCVEIELIDGRKVATVHTGCRISNKTTVKWNVGMMIKESIQSIGLLDSSSKIYLPFEYIKTGKLIFKPEDHSYSWSGKPKAYEILVLAHNEGKRLITCPKPNSTENYFCIMEIKNHTEGNIDCEINLLPPFSIENLLGHPIEYTLFEKSEKDGQLNGNCVKTIEIGEKQYLYSVNVKKNIRMNAKVKGVWKGNLEEFSMIFSPEKSTKLADHFINFDEDGRKTKIFLEYDNLDSLHDVKIYTPYWIINQSNLKINLRIGNDLVAGQSKNWSNPLLFSYLEKRFFGNRITIEVDDNYVSKPFSIDNVGTAQNIVVSNENVSMNIGCYVELGTKKYKRTKIITLSTMYKLVNKTGETISVKQFETKNEDVEIKDGQNTDFYFKKISTDPMILMKLENSNWGMPFRLNNLGSISFLLSDGKQEKKVYCSAQIVQEKGVVFVVFEKLTVPPYYIDNQSQFDVMISQKDVNRYILVEKNSKIEYTWQDCNEKHILLVTVETKSIELNLDVVASTEKLFITNQNCFVELTVQADKQSRVLKIIESKSKKDEKKESKENSKSVNNPIFNFNIQCDGIGLSLINNHPLEEIAYLYFENIIGRFKMNEKDQYFELKVKKIQLDNQLVDAMFPVAATNAKYLDEDKFFLHISMVRNYKVNDYDFIPYFSVLIQEGKVQTDWIFIKHLIDYFTQLKDIPQIVDEDNEQFKNIIDEPITEPVDTQKSYFNLLQLHPVRVNSTFIFNRKRDDNSSFAIWAQTLGAFNVKIDDIPVRLNSLILHHPFMSRKMLLEKIGKHYLNNLLSEMYTAIGSMDLIGNPVGLFNDLDTAVFDLFYEPIDGMTKSPEDFTKGIAKGSLSFLKHSVHGTFNTASKFTQSIGNGFSYLSMDMDFIESRTKSQAEKPKHIGEGFLSGTSSMASSVMDGATGIFVKPVQGATEEGFSGFMKGIGKGIIGIPVKPITGIFDLASKTTEGIRNTTTYFESQELHKIRKPRIFGRNGRLIPYDEKHVEGIEILRQIGVANIKYKDHVHLSQYHVLYLTNMKVYYIQKYDKETYVIEWEHTFDEIERVDLSQNNKLFLGLSKKGIENQQLGWFQSPIKVREIESEENDMKEIVSKILEYKENL